MLSGAANSCWRETTPTSVGLPRTVCFLYVCDVMKERGQDTSLLFSSNMAVNKLHLVVIDAQEASVLSQIRNLIASEVSLMFI